MDQGGDPGAAGRAVALHPQVGVRHDQFDGARAMFPPWAYGRVAVFASAVFGEVRMLRRAGHVEFDFAVEQHVLPEKRCQAASVFGGEQIVPVVVGEDVLEHEGVHEGGLQDP